MQTLLADRLSHRIEELLGNAREDGNSVDITGIADTLAREYRLGESERQQLLSHLMRRAMMAHLIIEMRRMPESESQGAEV